MGYHGWMKLLCRKINPPLGIYVVKGVPNSMPPRVCWLHPEAAAGFVALEAAWSGGVYSDIARSAEASLAAMTSKAGVQPPGWSGHNFGFSVDWAVDETIRRTGRTYAELVQLAAGAGWYAYRRDLRRGSEDWHLNWLGPHAGSVLAAVDPLKPGTWAAAAEGMIQRFYAPDFALSLQEAQEALGRLKLYSGAPDGAWGPLSTHACAAFQRAWRLPDSGMLDARTARTLAFVAAEQVWQ